ncbi:MAG: anthranilate phosphoribosyltransferase [Pseudomonadales bacterium]
MTTQTLLSLLVNGENLSESQMVQLMRSIMTGEATPAQIGAALTALKIKGESITEIAAAAQVMRELATPLPQRFEHLVDTCGTGGSGIKIFNVSTASAIVAAAGGVRIAKHGNRAATGVSGSADLLEAAGVRLDLSPEQVGQCIATVGVGFLFALNHHSAMRHAIGARRELAFKTMFNMLGPLTNPAGARCQVVGVSDRNRLRPMAEVLKKLGGERALVVHSEDGHDEISIAAPTFIAELLNGEIKEYTVRPEDFGWEAQSWQSLTVNNAAESLVLVQDALGARNETALKMVALNAGAALYIGSAAENLEAGVLKAEEILRSGLAAEKLEQLVTFSQSLVVNG